jgi:hypothetical protein
MDFLYKFQRAPASVSDKIPSQENNEDEEEDQRSWAFLEWFAFGLIIQRSYIIGVTVFSCDLSSEIQFGWIELLWWWSRWGA